MIKYCILFTVILLTACGDSVTDTDYRWAGLWTCETSTADYQFRLDMDDYAIYTIASKSANTESKIVQGKARLKDGYINIKMESLRVYQGPKYLTPQNIWTVIIEGRQFKKI
jgi:hypothetical protein